jgi:nitrilase
LLVKRGARTVRSAVVQAAPVAFDKERTLTRVEDLAAEASGQGAHLTVFPEAFVSGYPKGITFGTVIGARTPAGRDHFRRYWESALEVPGPDVDRLAALAAATALHMVVGVIERSGGTLYCTALFFSPEAYLGKHRKLMPTAAERLVWGFGDGSTLPVFETPLGRLGAVICWENYMPLLRTAMYSKNVELYCAPTADGRESWIPTVRHIAMEGRCFVLSCNQFARRRDYPADIENVLASGDDDVIMRGGSCIVGPLGQLLAGPDYESERILYADLDLDDIPRAKFDFDVVGHYARPDVFHLSVNEDPQTPVGD